MVASFESLPPDAVANMSKIEAQARAKAKAGLIKPNLIRMDTISPQPINWLWPGRIAAGRISLLVGRPGEGKSFLTCDMAARISKGMDWPDGSPCPQGSVLFITAEDDPADTIRPRLDACGADVTKIHLLSGLHVIGENGQVEEAMFSLAHCPQLEEALAQIQDCKLVILDPIGSFLGGKVDSHRDNEVRGMLAPLSKVAERTGAAIFSVLHNRKSAAFSADDTAMGSRAFTGLARSVWHLMKDPEAPERKLFLAGKNNLSAACDGLAFSIAGNPGCVRWEDESVDMSADDALIATQVPHQQNNSAKALDEAVDWLKDRLSRGDEECNSIKLAAERAGHKIRTIERAASERLKVRKYRPISPGPMWWSLKHDDPVRQQTSSSPTELFGELPKSGELEVD